MKMAIEGRAANNLMPLQPNTRHSDNPRIRINEATYYTHDQLTERGWTGKWIKRFSADKMVRYAGAICFCRFWDRLKMQEIECSQEWQAYRRAMDAGTLEEHAKDSARNGRDGDE
jgi:hypothetical protein